MTLNVSGDLDSSGIYGAAAPNPHVVPATTIDLEVAERGLQAPFVIKLDTHGFELPILNGARGTLRKYRS